LGYVLRSDGLLHEITEGRMMGKPTRGRRRVRASCMTKHCCSQLIL